jgi:hypothetical protein
MLNIMNHISKFFGGGVICATILFIIIVYCYSCTNNSERIYIISKQDSIKKEKYRKKGGVILAPPEIAIGTFNFIIDEESDCYFYVLPTPVNRGVSGDDGYEKKTIPVMPDNIIKIPRGCEQRLIEQNILGIKSGLRLRAVTIASFKDTIDNPIVWYLQKLALDTSKHLYLSVRRVVDEEKVILNNKFKVDRRSHARL